MKRWEIIRRLEKAQIIGSAWGDHGESALARIESSLGKPITGDFAIFIKEIGNLRIGPFSLIVGGSDDQSLSALSESRGLPEDILPALKIMEHAGEAYLYLPEKGAVHAFDLSAIQEGYETLRFPSFAQFVDWLFEQASEEKNDPLFKF